MIMQSIETVAAHLDVIPGLIYYGIATEKIIETNNNVDLLSTGVWVREMKRLPILPIWRWRFVEKFTSAEQTAVATNPQSLVWWIKILDTRELNLNDLSLIGTLQTLVSLGILTQQRVNEILSK